MRQASGIELEEGDYQVASGCLTVNGPVFSTNEGLVFRHAYKGLRWLANPIHEPLLEDLFDVVPPCIRKGPACDSMRGNMVSRVSHEQAACFWREAQACSVEELAAPAWSNLVMRNGVM